MDLLLKVLVVDDEWIIRDGLQHFPWNEFDCEIVGEAEDGEEGLLHAKVLQPDIILTDIRMPGMDGLEFAAQIRRFQPDAEIIFLTGYDNFEFAQAAIKTNAYDYLLKPTDFEEMKKVVAGACRKIRSRREQAGLMAQLQARHEQALPMMRDKLVYDLLHGRLRGTEIGEKLALFDLHPERYVVLSSRLDWGEDQRRRIGMDDWLLEFGIGNIATEILERSCECLLRESDRLDHHFILCFSPEAHQEDIYAVCIQCCEKIQKAVRTYIQSEIGFGISTVSDDIRQVNLCFQQAYDACRKSFFFDRGAIMRYSDLGETGSIGQLLADGEWDNLYNAISTNNRRAIQAAALSLSEGAPGEIGQVQTMAVELIWTGARVLDQSGAVRTQSLVTLLSDSINAVYSCATLEQLVENVLESLNNMADINARFCGDYHTNTVNSIIRFIREHYAEDLSLDQLSGQFGLSNAYISRLVKKQTGSSFVEILAEFRMQRARELLLSGERRIHEIAEQVGYRDVSYFSQVFRKKFGVKPSEYKNFIE